MTQLETLNFCTTKFLFKTVLLLCSVSRFVPQCILGQGGLRRIDWTWWHICGLQSEEPSNLDRLGHIAVTYSSNKFGHKLDKAEFRKRLFGGQEILRWRTHRDMHKNVTAFSVCSRSWQNIIFIHFSWTWLNPAVEVGLGLYVFVLGAGTSCVSRWHWEKDEVCFYWSLLSS